jgi:hypothetical protein
MYWAQSTTDLFIMFKLHEGLDETECLQSFEREVVMDNDAIKLEAYCMESEDNIRKFESDELLLSSLILPEKSFYEWKGEGRLIFTLKKANGPSFWKNVLKDKVKEIKDVQIWWEMREKNIEILEEYMAEEEKRQLDSE